MPIYEYRCEACGQHTELVQKFSDPPATDCPHCQAPKLQKLISAAAFHLKGNGWYVTDFRDKKSDVTTPTTDKTEDKPDKKVDNKQSTSTESAKDGGQKTTDRQSD